MVTKKELQEYNFRKWLPKSFRWAALEFITIVFNLSLILYSLIAGDNYTAFHFAVFTFFWYQLGRYKNSNFYLCRVIDDTIEMGKISIKHIDKSRANELTNNLKHFKKHDSYFVKEGEKFNEPTTNN